MVLVKRYWILIGLVVVLLGGTLAYFGWTKQKSAPVGSQQEQTKPEPVKQVIIPSSLDLIETMIQFVPYMPPWGDSISEKSHFWDNFETPHPHEGFDKGFFTVWLREAYYIKKDGTKIEGPDDPYSLILYLAILNYKKPEFARENYERISTKQEFRDSSLAGVKLKANIEAPSAIWPLVTKDLPLKFEPGEYQQYLLYSNNFIIYAYGLKEAAEDVMIRVIDRYAVE